MTQITVRQMNFDFPDQIERYWYGNSPFKTHFFNSITLVFPDAEQYMLRMVKRQLKHIDNPQLKKDVLGFIGQEAQHSIQHEKFWDNLHQQGYKFDTYLHFLRFILFDFCTNRLSLKMNLALMAGTEHFTNIVAEMTLKEELFTEAEPRLKELFKWHAAEEIEHKTVVYDVLQDATKSYLIRLIGFFTGYTFIIFFISLGLITLLYQDKKLLDIKAWWEMIQFLFTKEKFVFKVLSGSVEYFRKNFHPLQRDNLFLIDKYFSELSLYY